MKKLLILLLSCAAVASSPSKEMTLSSPNSQNKIAFELGDEWELYYTVDRGGKEITVASAMGFEFKDGTSLSSGFKLTGSSRNSINEVWETIWGQQQEVLCHYNELTLKFNQEDLNIKINVIARAFDDGVAFRYEFPQQDGLKEFIIMDELTEFNFAEDSKGTIVHATYVQQSRVEIAKVSVGSILHL